MDVLHYVKILLLYYEVKQHYTKKKLEKILFVILHIAFFSSEKFHMNQIIGENDSNNSDRILVDKLKK